jgi:hypothetical protein
MKKNRPGWAFPAVKDVKWSMRIRNRKLTYLPHRALWDLAREVRRLDALHIPGGILEAGAALGGSAIMIAHAKSKDRPLWVYDVFGMIPPPSEVDGEDVHQRYKDIQEGKSEGIQGDLYYGYQQNLKHRVTENFLKMGFPLEPNSIQLVEGLFEDTLPLLSEKVAFAHIDGDWYASVKVCLRYIAPKLSVGGRMIFDDYDAWSGCRRAIDEFLAENGSKYRREQHRRLHLIRISE